MKRGWIKGLIAALVVGLIAAWAASPVFAARALTQAARTGDEQALSRLVDFPAFRESLKDELGGRLMAEMRTDPRARDHALSGLGMMLAPALVSGAVEAFVTPQAISAMVRTAEGPEPTDRRPPDPGDEADADRVKQSWAYRDLNTFAVTLWRADRPDDRLALLLHRRGPFGWKLAAIDLDEAS